LYHGIVILLQENGEVMHRSAVWLDLCRLQNKIVEKAQLDTNKSKRSRPLGFPW